MGSLLPSPGSWCTQGCVCALQESISPVLCKLSSSMAGLMATSSMRAYAIPKSAAPSPSLLHPEHLPLWPPTADQYLHRRYSNTVLSQSLCDLWVLIHTRVVCALQESVSQSCVSSGGSMVGLMAISSKKAYATPRSAAPRAPAPVVVHCSPVPPQETLRHSSISVSVGSLGPGAHKVCFSPLSISGRNRV